MLIITNLFLIHLAGKAGKANETVTIINLISRVACPIDNFTLLTFFFVWKRIYGIFSFSLELFSAVVVSLAMVTCRFMKKRKWRKSLLRFKTNNILHILIQIVVKMVPLWILHETLYSKLYTCNYVQLNSLYNLFSSRLHN